MSEEILWKQGYLRAVSDAWNAVRALQSPISKGEALDAINSLSATAAYMRSALASGANFSGHDSDCATHNAPALPVGPCDCSEVDQLRRALDGVLGMAENFLELHMMANASKDPDIIRARAALKRGEP